MQAKKKGILTPETAHNGRLRLEHPSLGTESHPPAVATGRRPSDATRLEMVNRRRRRRKLWRLPRQHACGRKVDKVHNKEGWRDSGVRHIRKSWSCLHCCSISGCGGTTNGVAVMHICTTDHGGQRLNLSHRNI